MGKKNRERVRIKLEKKGERRKENLPVFHGGEGPGESGGNMYSIREEYS